MYKVNVTAKYICGFCMICRAYACQGCRQCSVYDLMQNVHIKSKSISCRLVLCRFIFVWSLWLFFLYLPLCLETFTFLIVFLALSHRNVFISSLNWKNKHFSSSFLPLVYSSCTPHAKVFISFVECSFNASLHVDGRVPERFFLCLSNSPKYVYSNHHLLNFHYAHWVRMKHKCLRVKPTQKKLRKSVFCVSAYQGLFKNTTPLIPCCEKKDERKKKRGRKRR